MFLGQYQHSLDEKGRLTIPAAFRDALGEGAFVSQGFDRNLMVMGAAYFQQVYERINAMSITDPAARLLRRLILSSAYQVEVDKAGRILLPQNLRLFMARPWLSARASTLKSGHQPNGDARCRLYRMQKPMPSASRRLISPLEKRSKG